MDPDTLRWAHTHLGSYLPTPTQNRSRTLTNDQALTAATPTSRMEEIALQLSAATHSLIQSTIKCNDSTQTTQKEIPENLTCFLIGISSLSWEEQHLLAPIWSELYKQPNKLT